MSYYKIMLIKYYLKSISNFCAVLLALPKANTSLWIATFNIIKNSFKVQESKKSENQEYLYFLKKSNF